MSAADRQQELESERLMYLLAILQKVSRGIAGEPEARLLATELGITTQYQQERKSNGAYL